MLEAGRDRRHSVWVVAMKAFLCVQPVTSVNARRPRVASGLPGILRTYGLRTPFSARRQQPGIASAQMRSDAALIAIDDIGHGAEMAGR